MIKRIGLIIFSTVLLVILVAQFTHHKVLAVTSNPTTITSTTTFTIRGGNENDAFDANGNAILKAHRTPSGINVIKLDASLNGRTAELPVGTKILLYSPTGVSHFTIGPAKGVIEDEATKGFVHLPDGGLGLLEVVGQGTATISVTEIKGANRRPITNSALNSQNWSGYKRTTGTYTDITSQWTVPTASSCSVGNDTYSASWPGLDDGNDANGDLIQTGTEQDCVSGNPWYRAWWEVLPQYSTTQRLDPTSYPVSAGDRMFAEIKQNSGSSWTITINNLTQNWASPFTTTQTYNGSGITSEWVIERPKLSGGTLATLTNYGSTSFINDSQNGVNPQHSYSTDSENMTSDGTSSGTILSIPSNPNSLKDAFAVAYGSTQPSAPASWSNNSPSPTANATDSILAMAASSISNAYAAGWERPSGYAQQPVMYNFDGSQWHRYFNWGPGGSYTNHYLYGVVTSSSTNAYAVGTTGTNTTLAYHWNGTSWSQVTSDNPDGTNSTNRNQLLSAAMDSSNTAWAAGSYGGNGDYQMPLIEKWNGTKFAQQTLQAWSLPTPNYGVLNGISVNSSTNGWAVGQVNWVASGAWQEGYLIYQYNGSSWTPTVGATSSGTLNSVVAVSNSEAWAVGNHLNGTPLILHYTSANGWVEDTSFNGSYPATITGLKSVSADSSNDVWIVGSYSNGTNQVPFTMLYNGSWAQVSTPSVSGNAYLQGVAVNSGIGWAGGYSGSSSSPSPLTFESL